MAVAVTELQKLVDKDVVLHLIQEDGSLKEVEGKIKAASAAGVPFKPKGKADVELLFADQIEEASAAPTKPKSITQKKLKPIIEGQMRQHLADRHGIEISWCRDATEKDAVEFHNSIDHSKLGHIHVAESKDERQEALADESAA